jgi:hypothetical protein
VKKWELNDKAGSGVEVFTRVSYLKDAELGTFLSRVLIGWMSLRARQEEELHVARASCT